MYRTPILSTIALMLCTPAALAVTFTVGDELGCNYPDVQSAISMAGGAGPHLLKIKTQVWTDQNINVAGKDITLRGGYATCAAASPTSASTLSGAGGAQASVFTITGGGNDVIFENMAIIRGDEVGNGTGGGIDFRGDGTLTLRRTVVSQNYAGYGAGINVAPGVSAELVIEAGTLIQLNLAQISGGGIRIEGNTHMVMDQADTTVYQNEALGIPEGGFGGGVEVIAPAVADIGSSGYNGNGVIYANTAKFGGGISVNGNESVTNARVNLYSVDPELPVRIQNNRATEDGGGIYLQPYVDINDHSYPTLYAQDVRIDGNRAQQGSAIYVGSDYDGIFETIGGFARILRTETCSAAALCNTITDNINENAAGQVLDVYEDNNSAYLDDCLIVENIVSGNLLLMAGGGDSNDFHVRNCTIAGNTIGAAHTISVNGATAIERSIVHQPGKSTLLRNGGTLVAGDVIANDTVSLGGGSVPTLLAVAPRFIDPAHGDYHLQAASPAVDFSSYNTITDDLDGESRGVELERVVNRFGKGDLGAYERQDVGNLVLNRGFIQDLRLWDVVTANTATWQAAGKDSAGAVLISKAMASGGQVTGLSQCVRIPGPGAWKLTGFGYGTGADAFNRDRVAITWKLRANTGGESCTGAITAQGELAFPNTATWAAQVEPEYIDVPQESWTRLTAIELSLVVREGSININATTSGYFDGIVLEPTTLLIDDLFEDGFE